MFEVKVKDSINAEDFSKTHVVGVFVGDKHIASMTINVETLQDVDAINGWGAKEFGELVEQFKADVSSLTTEDNGTTLVSR